MTARVVHKTGVDTAGRSHYAFCHPWACGWTGPLRRRGWLARRDARRHLAAFGAR